MKGVSWVIGLFALAVGLSLFAQINTGYAILFMPPFRVELSLNMAIVLALGLLALSYMGLRMLAAAVGLPRQVARYQRRGFVCGLVGRGVGLVVDFERQGVNTGGEAFKASGDTDYIHARQGFEGI